MNQRTHTIGIDATDTKRFIHWKTYSQKTLKRFFSQAEIDYCLSIPAKSAERFAARFAAREAFYKALTQRELQQKMLPLLTIAKYICIIRDNSRGPFMQVNWNDLKIEPSHVSLSITHTDTIAIACVLLTAENTI